MSRAAVAPATWHWTAAESQIPRRQIAQVAGPAMRLPECGAQGGGTEGWTQMKVRAWVLDPQRVEGHRYLLALRRDRCVAVPPGLESRLVGRPVLSMWSSASWTGTSHVLVPLAEEAQPRGDDRPSHGVFMRALLSGWCEVPELRELEPAQSTVAGRLTRACDDPSRLGVRVARP